MKTATRDQIRYRHDREFPPVFEIESGEEIVFETWDARTGTIRSNDDLLDHAHPDGANPATGPVFVNGAEPGDSLAVEILQIDLAESGFLAVKDGVGLLAHRTDGYATRIVPIEGDTVKFSDMIQFPVRPMVGVIGTAPAGSGIETLYPGPHGGNMDNRWVKPGAIVHLPVAVPGGLLAIGDVHASMGDGEITMIGLEICADVRVRVTLHRHLSISRPFIETANHWITTGDHLDPAEALRIAAEEMVDFLQANLDLDFDDAYMLMSARADIQVCQICDPGGLPVTARAVFPKLSQEG